MERTYKDIISPQDTMRVDVKLNGDVYFEIKCPVLDMCLSTFITASDAIKLANQILQNTPSPQNN